MIHLAIVEDEQLYIDQLTEYIHRYEAEKKLKFKISVFSDGAEIVEDYKGVYDIIFLDIQMKFMNGMDAAEKIRELDPNVVIIFITNMTQYAVRGYEVDALDYIVKPVEYFSFSQKFSRALGRIKKDEAVYISIPLEDGILKVAVDDIDYIESQSHSMIYYTKKGTFHSRGTMRGLEEKLCNYGFFRANKGYLVNMKHVDGVADNCCLIGGGKLPISRTRRKPFMDALIRYMSEVMN